MRALRALLLLGLLPLAGGVLIVTYQDAVLTHYPARAVIASELRALRIPFVHPGASCGQPLAGNPNFGVFFPDTLLAAILPLPVAFGLRFALAAALAFLGARRWARAEGASREAAEVAALAFALSGVYVSTWRFFNSGLALAVAPWVLAATAKLGRRAGEAGPVATRRAVAELALWGGLEILAGEPVIALLTFALAALRAAVSTGFMRPRALGSLAAGLVLAGVIGAPQIAATAQILGATSRERKPIPFVTATGTSVHPLRLLEQAAPHPFGRPDLRGPGGFRGHRFFDNHPPYLWTLHVGLVVLALLTLHGPGRGRKAAFFIATSGIAVVLSLGKFLPGAKLLYPWLSLGGRIRFPVKWWYVVALALVPLVAWAADRWLRGEETTRGRRLALGLLATASVAALVGAWPATLLGISGPLLSLVLAAALLGRARPPLFLASATGASLFLCALPQLLALLDVPPQAPPRLSTGRVYSRIEAEPHPFSPDAGGTTTEPVREFFRRASPELWALTGTREGIGYAFDLDPDGAYADEDRAIRKALDPLPWVDRVAELRMAGVTTVVSDEPLPPPFQPLRELNPALGVAAFALPDAAPGVRVATRAWRGTGLPAVMALHRDAAFDPATDVVLEGPDARPQAPAPVGRVLRSRETPATLDAEVEAAQDAIVVWSRTFFSAWEATVDGAPVPPIRADGHLVGVPFPSGRHRLEVRWRATPVYAGLGLAALGLLTAAGLRLGPRG